MKLDVGGDELSTLLQAPSPATLTLYRQDGEALVSPVWFRVEGPSDVRLPFAAARAWSLADTLPPSAELRRPTESPTSTGGILGVPGPLPSTG